MDDQQTTANAEEELINTEEVINITEEISDATPQVSVLTLERRIDDAGPSGTTYLPGAIQSPRPKQGQKAGLSKSDHCIRQIITTKDVTNALKSLSFGTPNQKLTTLDHQVEHKEGLDLTTLIDLKKFMISCFKLNKETPVVVSEIPLEAIRIESPNVSCNAETECAPIPNLANEVIITGGIEPKVSKSSKKKQGSLSDRSDLAIAQRDSLSSIGSNVCRICMTRGRERLISPCNCKGSLANVHLSCLERWLNQVGRNHCELCGFSYPAIRTPRYTVLQALRLWFGNPRNRSHLQAIFIKETQETPRALLCLPDEECLTRLKLKSEHSACSYSDCLIFWLLSTVTAGLLAVCIVGTQYFVIEGNKFGKPDGPTRKEEGFRIPGRLHDSLLTSISHRITETAMDFFMAIVLCGYSVTVYLLWKDHYVMWNRWRRANVNVRLLLAPDTNPVPFAPRPGYNVV